MAGKTGFHKRLPSPQTEVDCNNPKCKGKIHAVVDQTGLWKCCYCTGLDCGPQPSPKAGQPLAATAPVHQLPAPQPSGHIQLRIAPSAVGHLLDIVREGDAVVVTLHPGA